MKLAHVGSYKNRLIKVPWDMGNQAIVSYAVSLLWETRQLGFRSIVFSKNPVGFIQVTLDCGIKRVNIHLHIDSIFYVFPVIC